MTEPSGHYLYAYGNHADIVIDRTDGTFSKVSHALQSAYPAITNTSICSVIVSATSSQIRTLDTTNRTIQTIADTAIIDYNRRSGHSIGSCTILPNS